MPSAINTKNLNVTIDKNHILHDISVAVPAERVIGLLGPSGAGKTTLMRTIVGLQRIASGTATVLGQPAGSAELRSQIGYMAQTTSVYPDLTVAENLRYFASVTDAGQGRVAEVLSEVELTPQAKQIVSTLSNGQRARVSLAVALLARPKLFILDEPTVGLDPLLREKLWSYFHQLADNGHTLLVSSHVMDEAKRCDSLILIRRGRVLASDTPRQLQQQTSTKDVEDAFIKLVGDTS